MHAAVQAAVVHPPALDQGAALRLLLTNRAMLIGYINAITGDPTLTEDVFQEVSLVVLAKHAVVADVEGFRPWVRTIARFQSLKAVNRRSNSPLILVGEAIERLDRAWEDLDVGAAKREPLAALTRCLAGLTPRARQLVTMRYHQNLSGERIAEQLQRPLNTIYVAMSRIHRTLGACIRQELSRREISDA